MSDPNREAIEHDIGDVLLGQWDPLAVHDRPGPHEEYSRYVPGIYSLLARGGSDLEVGRRLQQIERADFGGADPPTRDLRGVLQALREIEHRI
jgi:hypothetical protein